eukprot:gene16748-biopygen1658
MPSTRFRQTSTHRPSPPPLKTSVRAAQRELAQVAAVSEEPRHAPHESRGRLLPVAIVQPNDFLIRWPPLVRLVAPGIFLPPSPCCACHLSIRAWRPSGCSVWDCLGLSVMCPIPAFSSRVLMPTTSPRLCGAASTRLGEGGLVDAVLALDFAGEHVDVRDDGQSHPHPVPLQRLRVHEHSVDEHKQHVHRAWVTTVVHPAVHDQRCAPPLPHVIPWIKHCSVDRRVRKLNLCYVDERGQRARVADDEVPVVHTSVGIFPQKAIAPCEGGSGRGGLGQAEAIWGCPAETKAGHSGPRAGNVSHFLALSFHCLGARRLPAFINSPPSLPQARARLREVRRVPVAALARLQ